MKYYKLVYNYWDPKSDNAIICRPGENFPSDWYLFDQGVEIKDWDEHFTVDFDPNEGMEFQDWLALTVDWIIVSSRVRKTFEDNNIGNIQYLPITIRNKVTGQLFDNLYWIINIPTLTDALDKEHSTYVYSDPNDSGLLMKYALKRSKIKDLDILRLPDEKVTQFVSERFRTLILQNGYTGFNFRKVKVVEDV